ncbi:MAG: polysaccharide deacetylase family protein [Synergistaceae bacterium]|nr:polysaccharide deacetylase family protein [Synergistaceae bacterium]MBR0094026.1 polysaccharide deacetylase family protein [Synergistaceae bacterium]
MLRRLMLLALIIFLFIEWGPLTDERAKYGIAAGDPFVREIVLTFDDGPREHGMQELNAVLTSHDVKGTFFLVGKFADRYAPITKMLNDAGHELENHSFTHPRLYRLWVEKIMREAERCDEVFESLSIRKTRFMRPPGGGFNMKIFNAMRRMNLKLGLWSLNTADYTGRPAEEITRLVLSSVRAGDVILMHSGTPNTVEALPEIITKLKERGFTFVRLEELYSRGKI